MEATSAWAGCAGGCGQLCMAAPSCLHQAVLVPFFLPLNLQTSALKPETKEPQSSGLALRAPDTIFLLMTASSERGYCPCKSQGLCGCLAHQQLAAARGQRAVMLLLGLSDCEREEGKHPKTKWGLLSRLSPSGRCFWELSVCVCVFCMARACFCWAKVWGRSGKRYW